MKKMKKIRNFIYQYQADGTVVVANLEVISRLVGQLSVHSHMDRISNFTGYFCDIVFEGMLYIGMIFENVPEEVLIEALSN